MKISKTSIIALLLWLPLVLLGQTGEQLELEKRKKRLQQEIKQISKLLQSEQNEREGLLEDIQVMDGRIDRVEKLIALTNQQNNLITKQINGNLKKIDIARKELGILRKDYAQLLLAAHRQKSKGNRILFILSAQDFWQAYKRLQYTKQYANHRKQQSYKIKQTTEELAQLNKGLLKNKAQKDQLVSENKQLRNSLENDRNKHQALLTSVKANEAKYKNSIAAKTKESERLDKQISALIKAAIAANNKKTGSKSTNRFELTPERLLVANNFKANKGKLPWPVNQGVISQGFGVYADKLYPGIKHNNNGVTITTDKNAEVRAIFDGEVISVEIFKTGQRGIYIRHGDFVTMYFNLAQVSVTKGDRVKAKQTIGKVFDGRGNTGKLKFYVYQNTTKLNPQEWLAGR